MNSIKIVSKYLLIFFSAVILGIVLLVLVSLIPKKYIEKNVILSALYLEEEGEIVYKETLTKQFWKNARITYNHNSTDAIMINNVYSIDRNNILESILLARRNYIPGITTNVVKNKIGDLSFNTEYNSIFSPTKELADIVINKSNIDSYEYARYWHGYIVILNILLLFFDIIQIKKLMTLILLVAFLFLTYLLYKKRPIYAIAFALSFISVNILSWGGILQGMFVMIIAMILSIFIALKKIPTNKLNTVLFVTGILTAYLDFLTTPIVTFLLPMIILNIFKDDNTSLKEEIFNNIKSGLAWLFGYCAFFIAKWVVVDLICQTDIIKNSFEQIGYRMDSGKTHNIRIKALINNVLFSINIIYIIICSLALISYTFNAITKGKKYILNTKNVLYCIYGIIPIIWYAIFAQHSFQHFHFTYRTIVITILCLILSATNNERKKL